MKQIYSSERCMGEMVPAAIFSGNLYDFGGFSQCFNIKRNDNNFETQYCFGQLVIDLSGDALSIFYDARSNKIAGSKYLLPQ